ncbi:hypothetical protein EHQ81_12030 [Leptospira selangorensis]|uniref:Uncharacterized protein n=1 Tax=Leptospira selangorensis TaxID=2484982 RepID=A0A5F2C1X9_9LEPT|nr:hypothetical protein [Leptospira selangorensis]TGM12976.1 hypothetical protein EHQ81_12030 [Leptospira selangorensis]TGM21273.1 hypothetical protein EHQ82_09720 [Leptospira selangorensis]
MIFLFRLSNRYIKYSLLFLFAFINCVTRYGTIKTESNNLTKSTSTINIEAIVTSGHYTGRVKLKKLDQQGSLSVKNVNGIIDFHNYDTIRKQLANIELENGIYRGEIIVIARENRFFQYAVEGEASILFDSELHKKLEGRAGGPCIQKEFSKLICQDLVLSGNSFKFLVEDLQKDEFSFLITPLILIFPIYTTFEFGLPIPLFGFWGYNRNLLVKESVVL